MEGPVPDLSGIQHRKPLLWCGRIMLGRLAVWADSAWAGWSGCPHRDPGKGPALCLEHALADDSRSTIGSISCSQFSRLLANDFVRASTGDFALLSLAHTIG